MPTRTRGVTNRSHVQTSPGRTLTLERVLEGILNFLNSCVVFQMLQVSIRDQNQDGKQL